MTRLLVTGSRRFNDRPAVGLVLLTAYYRLGGNPATILVSGACKTGADEIAEAIWSGLGMRVERHPADWAEGKASGPARNVEMVNAGADLCVAFLEPCGCTKRPRPHPTHGTQHCFTLAASAGIRVWLWDPHRVMPRDEGWTFLEAPQTTPVTPRR